ncbi:hypothetical protein [uncultured Tessaracoccus sp.]|uniref:hypothetical protein n=1 Tax=uncultured Tessaracoccus sp. TaxID=905023 RepID=UPI00262B1A7A|nr:hypothetical protein [uncultured Tessaracoccus sp.]
MKGRFIIGLIAVIAVLAGGTWLVVNQNSGPQPVTINCVGGSEKSDLMRDPDVVKILDKKYNITVKWTSMGSYDQVLLSKDEIESRGFNCLWPSSASARNVFEATHGGEFSDYRAETVLQSPEVIYAGPQGTEALTKAGLVTEQDKHHVLDFKALLNEHIVPKKQWQELHAGKLRGPINVSSTDPVKSNSGFTLAQLELTMLASADPYQSPSIAEARAALPTMRQIYDAQGLQATSSDNGFRQWLTQGGEFSAPLYAGYESQNIQQMTVGGNAERLMKNVTMLYPDPTVYSDHPILAINSDAQRLIEAMKDEEIQKLAWTKYGFRSSVNAAYNDMSVFETLPLAEQFITVPAPNSEVTLALLDCLRDRNACQ